MSLNKYVFDYNLVLKEDPTFEEFIEYGPQPGNQTEDGDTPGDTPFGSLCREVVTNIKSHNSVEENEIIDFVHNKDDEERPDWDAVDLNSNWHTRNAQRLKTQLIVNLKSEYENPANPNYDPSIPQLLPPNRFLKEGSEIWMGNDTLYLFHKYEEHIGYVSLINKYRFSLYHPFIRLISTQYWFDRSKNAMSERKTYFKLWVYNIETKQIYFIRKVKNNSRKGSHFRNSIRKIFNHLLLAHWNNESNANQISNKFLNSIMQTAIKDIGEVVIPELEGKSYEYEIQRIKLAITVLQHRIGQPTRWLNYLCVRNLWNIMGDLDFQDKLEFENFSFRKTADSKMALLINSNKCKRKKNSAAIRRKTIGQLIPNLQKSNHMRTAIKTVLGEDCSKLLVKLFNMLVIDKEFLMSWILCTRAGLIDKELYHWIAQAINDNNDRLTQQIITIIDPMLYSLKNNVNYSAAVGKSYIKTCKRLKAFNKDADLPHWHTWHDMYNMADQLNIRIRPNQLTTDDVISVHEKLTSIIRRDKNVINKYKDVIFDEFVCPDKDYDGFHFVQLRTAEELTHEGIVMHHCVGGYASNCAEGKSIIFSMRKGDRSYVTIELSPRDNHDIIQQYTLHDITVTNESILNLINKWHSDCVDLHVNDVETYYDKCKKRIEEAIQKTRNETFGKLFEEGIIENAAAV